MPLKRWSILTILISLIGTVILLRYIPSRFGPPEQTIVPNGDSMVGIIPNPPPPTTQQKPPTPPSILLQVPFTPQAPTANWDELHNEACEEASSIMAAEYFSGNKNTQLDPELVEGQITKLTEYEDSHFGYHLDTTIEETAQMMREEYALQTSIIKNFSELDLKTALSQEKLIIISFDGRLLGNPYYKHPGPPHHMLVVQGYNAQGFITNDPGTKRGQNYPYTFATLYNAAGDWDHSTNKVDLSKKVAIVVWK